MISDGTGLGLWLRGFRGRKQVFPSAVPDGIVFGTRDVGGHMRWLSPFGDASQHRLFVAASGAGKSVALAHVLVSEFIAAQALPEDERPSYFVADPKADLVGLILADLAARAPHLLDRVIWLDPFRGGFALNLRMFDLDGVPISIFALALAEIVAIVSNTGASKSAGGSGARQNELCKGLFEAVLDIDDPRASLLMALDALDANSIKKHLAPLVRSPRIRQYLEGVVLSEELRASTASRVRTAFAASEELERIVTAPRCLSPRRCLAPNRIVLFSAGDPPGGLLVVQKFYLNLFTRLMLQHLLARPSPWRGHHTRVVIDELPLVAPVLNDLLEVLLQTGRSRGVSFIGCAQGTTLLQDASPTLLGVAMSNIPEKYVGRMSAPDAELFARQLGPGFGVDEPVAALRSRFAAAVSNLEDRSFYRLTPGSRQRFRTIDVDLDGARAAAEAHADEIDALKRRYTLPKDMPPRAFLKDLAPAPERRRPAAARPKPVARKRWG